MSKDEETYRTQNLLQAATKQISGKMGAKIMNPSNGVSKKSEEIQCALCSVTAFNR